MVEFQERVKRLSTLPQVPRQNVNGSLEHESLRRDLNYPCLTKHIKIASKNATLLKLGIGLDMQDLNQFQETDLFPFYMAIKEVPNFAKIDKN